MGSEGGLCTGEEAEEAGRERMGLRLQDLSWRSQGTDSLWRPPHLHRDPSSPHVPTGGLFWVSASLR